MKVLQICSKPPLPEIDGGCKAMNSFTQGLLAQDIEVKVLTLSTQKHPFKIKELDSDYLLSTKISNTFVDTTPKPIAALFNILSNKSYNLERFNSREFDDVITATLSGEKFDIVLIEGLYVSMYLDSIRSFSSAKVIYREHNIESEIWYRNATEAKGLKKWYLNHLAKKLEHYEKLILNNFDGVAAITEKDKKKLIGMGCKIPIEVFPFGVDLAKYKGNIAINENSLFHIGSMEWIPNQKGINWFIEEVWEVVSKKHQNLEFYLAGKNMSDQLLQASSNNLFVLGEVDDAIDFINQNSIMVVPLFAASGMRIKIIEAMALGKLVIATSIAAEGITYNDKENIVIANNKEEFVSAITYYSTNLEEQERIAKNGRELIESNYDNQLIVNNLAKFFKQLN